MLQWVDPEAAGVFGTVGLGTMDAMIWFIPALASFIVLPIFLIALRAFGDRRAALASAAVLAVASPSVFITSHPMPGSIGDLLALMLFLVLLRLMETMTLSAPESFFFTKKKLGVSQAKLKRKGKPWFRCRCTSRMARPRSCWPLPRGNENTTSENRSGSVKKDGKWIAQRRNEPKFDNSGKIDYSLLRLRKWIVGFIVHEFQTAPPIMGAKRVRRG